MIATATANKVEATPTVTTPTITTNGTFSKSRVINQPDKVLICKIFQVVKKHVPVDVVEINWMLVVNYDMQETIIIGIQWIRFIWFARVI